MEGAPSASSAASAINATTLSGAPANAREKLWSGSRQAALLRRKRKKARTPAGRPLPR